MLLEFRSKAAGGFFFMPQTFEEVCRVLGVDYAESGAWEPELLAGYLATLEKAVADERQRLIEEERREKARDLAGRSYADDDREREEEERRDRFVSFAMRTSPLRDMMRRALVKQVPVMWGIP